VPARNQPAIGGERQHDKGDGENCDREPKALAEEKEVGEGGKARSQRELGQKVLVGAAVSNRRGEI
jgi:hypothetical protein